MHMVRHTILRVQRRMSTTGSLALIHPDKIFTNSPPLPQHWVKIKPIALASKSSPNVSIQWKEAKGNERYLPGVLLRFQIALRSVHKRKVTWPVQESDLSELSPDKYLPALLRPLANIFNQLRLQEVSQTPVECISIDLGESIYAATFSVGTNLDMWWIGTPPIVMALNEQNLFESSGKVSSSVEYALSQALKYNPAVTFIIVTNFSEIVVFSPSAWISPEPTYEMILTDKPALSLRVLSAAYLFTVAPPDFLINRPPPIVEVDESLILPFGPPSDPTKSLLSDEILFATHHRHSDFDLATLVRDRDRALQFFRWQEHVQQKHHKVVAHPNDILSGATNHIGEVSIPEHGPPIYPYDPSEITMDTASHLERIQRISPLVSSGIADKFHKSKHFTLTIENLIAEGSSSGICTVYRCRLTSIDDEPVLPSLPSLCLKLFDDRFQMLEMPDPVDDNERYKVVHRWFNRFAIAELYALNERFAYDKLLPVQGSVVPWFYGMHEFTLPNGVVLYGLLMEYIDGRELTPDFVHSLSLDRQIKMIETCRHAARVLDVADICQKDWHPGQVLICTKLNADIDHAVLIDFSMTTQTWSIDEPNLLSNYYGMLRVLSYGNVGFNWEFVWRHYGEPDDWDPIHVSRSRISTSGVPVTLKARDMFPYISST